MYAAGQLIRKASDVGSVRGSDFRTSARARMHASKTLCGTYDRIGNAAVAPPRLDSLPVGGRKVLLPGSGLAATWPGEVV